MLFNFVNPHLYLNPGTGSLVAQLLAAVVLGGGILVRIFWTRIRKLFSGKKMDASDPEDDELKND